MRNLSLEAHVLLTLTPSDPTKPKYMFLEYIQKGRNISAVAQWTSSNVHTIFSAYFGKSRATESRPAVESRRKTCFSNCLTIKKGHRMAYMACCGRNCVLHPIRKSCDVWLHPRLYCARGHVLPPSVRSGLKIIYDLKQSIVGGISTLLTRVRFERNFYICPKWPCCCRHVLLQKRFLYSSLYTCFCFEMSISGEKA